MEAGEAVTWQLLHGDARHVSDLVEPASVDAIITSPPYFALRSYRDGGEHYDGQIGSEPTPTAFLDALIECTRDWLTVLRPGGSLFINLGDKYAGGGGQWEKDERPDPGRRRAVSGKVSTGGNTYGFRPKSLLGLPWRYAIRCIDELGLILRAEIVWSKPNGIPESVTDRVRRSHEQWFHFTVNPRYYAGIDEIREPHNWPAERNGHSLGTKWHEAEDVTGDDRWRVKDKTLNPLGKLPGSVWTIPSEPLTVPTELDVDHFAAYPSEWPRRLILGWTPTGYCTGCGEPRRAVVDSQQVKSPVHADGSIMGNRNGGPDERGWDGLPRFNMERTILGYACACPTADAPTRSAVVLDPFCGTGTTVAVAHHLGRHGIGVDLSNDYLRLAEWRCSSDEALRAKVLDRSGIPRPQPPAIAGQTNLFGDDAA